MKLDKNIIIGIVAVAGVIAFVFFGGGTNTVDFRNSQGNTFDASKDLNVNVNQSSDNKAINN